MSEAYKIEWEDVRQECDYPASDDNNGYIYGIYWITDDYIDEVEWFKTEEERELVFSEFLQKNEKFVEPKDSLFTNFIIERQIKK